MRKRKKKFLISKMAEPEGMEVDSPSVPSTSSGSSKKRFEVKKVNVFPNCFSSVLSSFCDVPAFKTFTFSFYFRTVECCRFVGMG